MGPLGMYRRTAAPYVVLVCGLILIGLGVWAQTLGMNGPLIIGMGVAGVVISTLMFLLVARRKVHTGAPTTWKADEPPPRDATRRLREGQHPLADAQTSGRPGGIIAMGTFFVLLGVGAIGLFPSSQYEHSGPPAWTLGIALIAVGALMIVIALRQKYARLH